MPLFDYPGVYREEILTQRRVIQDVSTANLALVGFFEKGPVNEPVLVTDFQELTRVFGSFTTKSIAPTVAAAYYANGGQNAFVVRVVGAGALESSAAFADEIRTEDTGALSTGGGATDALSFTTAQTPIAPGSVRLFFNESLDVTAEAQGTTDGTTGPFTGTLDNAPIEPSSLTINFSLAGPIAASVTDDGAGNLTGGGTGTINYQTGAYSFMASGATEVGDPITADYTHAVANGNATVLNTPFTETVATQRNSQRVYNGELNFDWPVWYSVTFNWTDQGSVAREAVVSSSGVVSGDATGTLDLKTGEFSLDLGVNEIEVGGTMTATYWYFDPLEAVDDGAGALTTTGGLVSVGTVDYETGDITATTVALDEVGGTFWIDYDQEIHPSQAKNAGESGDNLRLTIEADENFLDATTGLYSKFTVTVSEVDEDGNEAARGSFSEVILDDITDPKHISQVVNDPFLGSDLVEMVTEFSDEIPTGLNGGTASGVLVDSGTGVVREIATNLSLNGGRGIVPGTLVVTYVSGTLTKTITDDAQGGLTGDVDSGATASIDYDTGVLIFTPSAAPDAASTVDAAYTFLSVDDNAVATYTGGSDGAALTRADVTDIALKATGGGIYALDTVDELLILSLPDFAGDSIAEAAQIAYVESQDRQDSMVLIAPPEGATVKQAINYKRVVLASLSNRAAMYYPWIQIEDPITGNTISIPPHGHVAGVWSKTDLNRNVGKAPAGINDGSLTFLLGFERNLKKEEVGLLNNANINSLWQPPRQPRSVWGVRTLEVGGEFRYINKRRTVDFVSVSVARAMWWAVFENIGPSLFVPVRQQIEGFLRRQFLAGILAGASQREAFFVKVDSGNNTPDTIAQGQLIVDYGVATQTPGEFIRLRHRQITG